MQKEIKELMKPRYMVIADYPLSVLAVGHIIPVNNEGDFVNVIQGGAWKTDITKYPHLFRKVYWAEYRMLKEMPQYVKLITKPSYGSYWEIGAIMKVTDWGIVSASNRLKNESEWYCKVGQHAYNACHVEPATEQEYTSYINNQNLK